MLGDDKSSPRSAVAIRHSPISAIIVVIASLWFPAASLARADPPIKLSVSWRGAPCNASGSLDVVLTNVSSRPITVPRHAVIPIFLAVEITSTKTETVKGELYDVIYGSYGHPFIFNTYPTDYETRGGMKVLGPGEAAPYEITLFDANTRDLETIPAWMVDDFEVHWRDMIRDGRGARVRYVLDEPTFFPTTKHLYYVSQRRKPEIFSNELTCPGLQAIGPSPSAAGLK